MLPSHSSADSNMRKGTMRKRSNASNDTESMQQGRKRETKHCVREGRWPCHPLAAAATAQTNLEDLALQLGLHGVSTTEVRELGLRIYLKTNEVRDPAACCEARTILDTKLGEADMYQHLSFFRKMLPDTALSDMHTMLHCYTTTCSRKHMRKGAQKHRTLKQPEQAEHSRMSALTACWKGTRNSWKGMRSKHAEWLRDARSAYSLSKNFRRQQARRAIRMSYTKTCGTMNKPPGVSFFIRRIWRICGCLCSLFAWQHTHVLALQLQQLLVIFVPQGCQLGPYLPNGAEHACLHIWLQPMSTVPCAWQTESCPLNRLRKHGLKSTVRTLLPASGRRSAITLPRQPKKKGKDALNNLQNGVLKGRGIEGRSTYQGLPVAYRPLPHTPRSMPEHHQELYQHATPPKPTPSQLLTRTEPNKDTRHHQGPPKPTRRCLPKEDARQKGVRRSKESITKSHLRRWPNLNLVCLIAWIEGSCTHHSIRDADISQRHGLSPASGLESQYKRVIAEHSMYIPMLEQDCRHVAARPNPRIAPLPYWEPQGPRKRCPVSTGVPQNLLPPCSQGKSPRQSSNIDPQIIYPDSMSAPPKPSLRRAVKTNADLRTSRPVPLQGAPAHVRMSSRSAACCSACTTHHASAECRQCSHYARQSELNHVCTGSTMPKPSEEPLPREGEPQARAQQQPRSRFRADGRRRRISGELKKPPYVQHWKDAQARRRQSDREPTLALEQVPETPAPTQPMLETPVNAAGSAE